MAAVVLPNVGDVIAITGATVNPFIGFIFPIMFYLKIDPSPMSSAGKRLGIFVILVTIIVSVLGIVQIVTTWESSHATPTTKA